MNISLDYGNAIIIPIGKNCQTAIFLRNCLIKQYSYPYDWVAMYLLMKLLIQIIKMNYIRKLVQVSDKKKFLPHDKEKDKHGVYENSFLNIDCLTKYKRRFNRLFNDIIKKNVVLVRTYNRECEKISNFHKNIFYKINPNISFIQIKDCHDLSINYELVKLEMRTIFK